MKVASIHIYPVKSLRGQALATAEVEPWGLRHDRRWLVLDPDGSVLTAREEHRLLGLSAAPTSDGVLLTSRDGQRLAVSTPTDGEFVPTAMSRLDSVRAADAEAQSWLSGLLERPARLAWLDDPRRRSVSLTHGGMDGDPLSLADAGPLLLPSTSSLQQLNKWMAEDMVAKGAVAADAVAMDRFRPSVVIDDIPKTFDEDSWRNIRIGEAEFRFAECCDHCVMTTIDLHTLSARKEPLRTLAAHRQWDHKTWFGIRVVPTLAAAIRVGDTVEALSRSDGWRASATIEL